MKQKPTEASILLEKYRQLQEENEKLKAELSEKKTIINRAKDITPVVRPRVNRVFKFLGDVGMGLSRVKGGWILEQGELRRRLKRLSTAWELVTSDGFVLKDIFINEQVKKLLLVSMPAPETLPPVIDADLSTEEKVKLIEKSAIAVSDSMTQSIAPFSLEQVAKALDYYKATIAKGKEIKSATGWLLKCLKEEWYNSVVPEPSPYASKIITADSLPHVEVARFPSDFWEKARSRLREKIDERLQQRLDTLVPY
ncbi:MAG: hypothetical protein KME01_14395 [Chroococcus sp. CMT-3BRIN-NPC107]|nr:hypothetical protein [Chroococcus sp. CMT-3BRIN-NPC107]